jgi:hypothetical protein
MSEMLIINNPPWAPELSRKIVKLWEWLERPRRKRGRPESPERKQKLMNFADKVERAAGSYYGRVRNRYQRAYIDLLPGLRTEEMARVKKAHQRGRSFWIEVGKRDPQHAPDWVQRLLNKRDIK